MCLIHVLFTSLPVSICDSRKCWWSFPPKSRRTLPRMPTQALACSQRSCSNLSNPVSKPHYTFPLLYSIAFASRAVTTRAVLPATTQDFLPSKFRDCFLRPPQIVLNCNNTPETRMDYTCFLVTPQFCGKQLHCALREKKHTPPLPVHHTTTLSLMTRFILCALRWLTDIPKGIRVQIP